MAHTSLALGHILIIDNDEDLAEIMSSRLSRIGYTCTIARTGAQGLNEFNPNFVDLVVTDLNMPVLDGLGVIEKIRQKSNVPIVVVTGFRKEYIRLNGIQRIAKVTVLEKPFDVNNFIEIVETDIFFSRSNSAVA